MKKILSIVLTVVMLGALLASAIPVFAADGDSGKLTLTVETVEANPGDTVDVKINLTNVTDAIDSVKATVTWDSKLTLIDAVYNCDFKSSGKQKSNTLSSVPDATKKVVIDGEEEDVPDWTTVSSPFAFSWMTVSTSDASSIKANGIFVTMTFKVAADAAGMLPITIALEDEDNIYHTNYETEEDITIPVDLVDGGVQTPEAAATATLKNSSYDDLFYDSTSILATKVELKIRDLEDKSILDFAEGAVSTITVRGWAWVNDSE
ncbi:MAG: hypothetical protein II739_02280, partial [Clostridia bacterium]|nr:hypothetical protein [Clostridia bacterium]